MDYTIIGSNQTVYAKNTTVTEYGYIYSKGSSNSIYLSKNVGAAPSSGVNYIYGVGTYNLLQYFSSPGPVTIDFSNGVAQNGYGGTDYFTGIIGFQGSSFSDLVFGGKNSEVFYLGSGSDTVYGGGGTDRVTFYSDLSTNYDIQYNLLNDSWVIQKGGEKKFLYSIDFVEFGDKTFISPKAVTLTNGLGLSYAGSWIPIKAIDSSINGTIANSFYALLKIGNSNQYSIVLTGWGYSGFDTKQATPSKVSIAIFGSDQAGVFSNVTSTYVADTSTWGGGSVVVADFNGDGRSDIFLAAHNESPFVPEPSTVYMSNSQGTFDKLTLSDRVEAHDASLFVLNGTPLVVATSYGGTDFDPLYTYKDGSFSIAGVNISSDKNGTLNEQYNGSATVIGKFGKGGEIELIRVDAVTYSQDWKTVLDSTIKIFSYSLPNNITSPPLQTIPAYLSTLSQYKQYQSMFGPGITHISRVWTEDLNHDGYPDLLVGESMWRDNSDDYPSALQVLVNNGTGTFSDRTSFLNPEISLNGAEFDYTPTFMNVDQSGIDTLLFSGGYTSTVSRQSNYVLLNDGTGRLYVALHDEFLSLTQLVYEYLAKYLSDYTISDQTVVPKFIGIPQPDGSLNFLVQVSRIKIENGIGQVIYDYINVPLHYNETTDFKRNITVGDRNNSLLMRAWAGNDVFYDTGANPAATSASPTRINGGVGLDTAIYSGKQASYSITSKSDGTFSVDSKASASIQVHDTLQNVERVKFTDTNLALDLGAAEHGGQALLLIGAVLGKDLMLNKRPLDGAVIDLLDQGFTVAQLAGALMRLPIWGGVLTPSNSSSDIASYLFTRVNGRTPTASELGAAVKSLDTDTQGAYLADLALSTSNIAQVDLVGIAKTGFEYPLAG